METKTRKVKYRVGNWPEYNQALVNRGRIGLWIDEEICQAWNVVEKSGKRGASQTFSDLAIQCSLTLKAVFHLPFRGAEGFLSSLLDLMGLPLSAPDYTTMCRRGKTLEVAMTRMACQEARHILVDSTGLKIFGEGEWKVRQHGYSKRRTWRKLHLGVDDSTKEIVAVELTANFVGDGEVLPDLLDQIDGKVGKVSGDGAYDTWDCHSAIQGRGAQAIIPPRENAAPWPIRSDGSPHPRNEILEEIQSKGRKQWKMDSGYHRRSLAETTMFRIKTIFGDRLTARLFESQAVEAYTRCAALNRMTALGMPESYCLIP